MPVAVLDPQTCELDGKLETRVNFTDAEPMGILKMDVIADGHRHNLYDCDCG